MARIASKRKPTWDYDRVRPVCVSVAVRMIRKFRGSGAYGLQDLVQEGLLVSVRAHQLYRERRGKYEAWIASCVRNRLMDLVRSASADVVRCERAAKPERVCDARLLRAQMGLSASMNCRRDAQGRFTKG